LMVFGLAGAAVAKDLASPGLVRGIVRAETQSTLASELVARITALPFKSGQAFQAGETLVQFDCSRYEAEIRATNSLASVD
ncbi:MAG: efflux RND transporter periplasmic adaptor subunit, partial [Pseudomonadota bacterium]